MSRILAAFLATLLAGAAAAQYPNKPIRLIVPFPPDGYTLFYATNTAFSWVPSVRKNPPYDPVADFTPVSMIGQFGFFLFSHPSVPANNMAELLAHIRANPGKLNYGSGNSTAMLSTAQLVQREKLDVVHIPYKGDGPLSIDLLGGRVQFAIATPGAAAPQVKEGRLRVLATLLPSRSSLLPQAPTMTESGLAGLSITPWGGIFGPKGMPREVADRLSRELIVLLKRSEVREAFGLLAFEPRGSTPEELAAFTKEQLEVWRRVVGEVGIKPE